MRAEDYESLVQRIVDEVVRRLDGPPAAGSGETVCGCGGCAPVDSGPSAVTPGSPAAPAAETVFPGRLLTAEKLLSLAPPAGAMVRLAPGTLVTPLARDLAKERGWGLLWESQGPPAPGKPAGGRSQHGAPPPTAHRGDARGRVAFFSARGGTTEEEVVRRVVEAHGLEWVPWPPPPPGRDPVEAALEYVSGLAPGRWAGAVVMLEEVYRLQRRLARTGGVEAQVCWDPRSAREARRRGAQVLLLSSRSLAVGPLRRIVEAWFAEDC